jgi:hypothetical protein
VDKFLWPYWRGYEIIVLSVPLNKLHGRVMHNAVIRGGGGDHVEVQFVHHLPPLRSFGLWEGPRQRLNNRNV